MYYFILIPFSGVFSSFCDNTFRSIQRLMQFIKWIFINVPHIQIADSFNIAMLPNKNKSSLWMREENFFEIFPPLEVCYHWKTDDTFSIFHMEADFIWVLQRHCNLLCSRLRVCRYQRLTLCMYVGTIDDRPHSRP